MSYIFVMFFVLGCCSTTAAAVNRNIFILAGQSNMAGRGGVFYNTWDGVVPPECHPSPSIFRLNANLEWEPAREPLHCDIGDGYRAGIGPGMPFATTLLKMVPSIGEIGLVPCAIGGSNISQWSRGSPFYNSVVARTAAALNLKGARLGAFLWYQGESDTGTLQTVALYKARFEQLVTDLRLDLHAPLLPVVEVAIASGGNETVREIVRTAQFDSARDLEKVECVDANGLEIYKFDQVHLSTAAQVKLGTEMAQAFISSQAHNICSCSAPCTLITLVFLVIYILLII